MTKRYRLLKDLPDIKAGTLFYRHPNGNYYITERNYNHITDGQAHTGFLYPDDPTYHMDYVEGQPDWFFELKGIDVELWKRDATSQNRNYYTISVPGDYLIPEDKLVKIKESIKHILNADPNLEAKNNKTISQLIEQAEKKAFEAGRDRVGQFWNAPINNFRFKSFEDYKNHLINVPTPPRP